MKVTLIGANIVAQKGDFFGTGIPYFPLVTAYTAANLRKHKYKIEVIDAFGENPSQIREYGNKIIFGLTPEEIIKKIDRKTAMIAIGAERVFAHQVMLNIIKEIRNKKEFCQIPIVVLENTQAVTAYALQYVKEELLNNGVNYIITGEPEKRILELLNAIQQNEELIEKAVIKIDGIIFKNKKKEIIENPATDVISDLDILPFPVWDAFKLENYWSLGYAHGPLTSKKYLPILTSRGCPYPCTFCVVPATNKQKWRPRSAKNVVDEIEEGINRFNVNEFHLEDLNPTIKKERIQEIAKEIIKRKLQIIWKIASGTKAETLDEETIKWMASSGCSYISISPESGSERIMKEIRKPFPYKRVLELVREMYKNNITTQACFVLGYPGENEEDIKKTKNYIKELVKAGISEIALFILTPVPGSIVYKTNKELRALNPADMTFSPKWRVDFKKYDLIRKKLYLNFIFWRTKYYPFEIIMQLLHIIRRSFKTKMEMTIYRITKVWWMCMISKRKNRQLLL